MAPARGSNTCSTAIRFYLVLASQARAQMMALHCYFQQEASFLNLSGPLSESVSLEAYVMIYSVCAMTFGEFYPIIAIYDFELFGVHIPILSAFLLRQSLYS